MAWNTYRLWNRKVVGASPHNHGRNHDPRVFDRDYTPTTITFRARSRQEAERKGCKFWEEAELGKGSFIMAIDREERKESRGRPNHD